MAKYRTVNGKKFKLTVLPSEYKPTPLTIVSKAGKVRLSNGKVDPTMIPASHR
jgi:hypothetical protein